MHSSIATLHCKFSMANVITLPFHQKILCKNNLHRATELVIFFLLLSLLVYRLRLLHHHGFVWLLAFFCESWFTFNWFLVMNIKWNPLDWETYPDRLLKEIHELPSVDLFVTTADAVLEPPIITVNTVLSLLALDYPANKLACYVSDDGASPITFYALVEAIKFAKFWIPFCKKYNIQTRAPFQYFSCNDSEDSTNLSSEFNKDSIYVKKEYEELCRKIEAAEQNTTEFDTDEFSPFSKIEKRNHETIVKVIWENADNIAEGVPHLVYVSREKRPKYPHHYKAGAMNVLTRVSGVMTNAPFLLNVDCDMFANNPQIVLHAMCLLLDSENQQEIAYVQCPQVFYGGLEDDPFGNGMVVINQYLGRGLGGIQGPFYGGTGCFHRRKVIYGLSPGETKSHESNSGLHNGKEQEALAAKFGCCSKLVKSACQTLLCIDENLSSHTNISSSVEAAIEVAGCRYESNTLWGTKIGLVYGSTTEDVLTGLGIHARGWRSVFFAPKPHAFLGCAPTGGAAVMTQQKRWATGFLEIIISKNSSIIATIKAKLWFRQCLGYLYVNIWGLRCIPELCYSVLPAYCLLTNTSFMPKVSENAIWIPATLLVIYNVHNLSEYLHCDLSIKAWWNNQRMVRIITSNAFLFGLLSVFLKHLGLSETVFEVTRKDKDQGEDGSEVDPGRFTFDDSPMFVPGTTLVLLHLGALVMTLLGVEMQVHSAIGWGSGEIISSALVLLTFLPFLKGLFRKGKYGIPMTTICKSLVLVGFFVHFCRRPSKI